MIEISKLRFDALAAYGIRPQAIIYSEQIKWFEAGNGRIVATIIRDRSDNDYGGIILAKDINERFRWIDDSGFFDTPANAVEKLGQKIESILPNLDEHRKQGDEKGRPVNFFSPYLKDKQFLAPSFVSLADEEGYSPARSIIEPMMRWYKDADGNFIEQFQTTGFDARIWELYLFAAFTEAGFSIDRDFAVPDYTCRGLMGEFCAEATTVNPSRDKEGKIILPPPMDTQEQFLDVMHNYLPIKYAGPLTTKLAKRYWEKDNAAGKPLIIAIQDFHAPMSMTWSQSALPIYLYGTVHTAHPDSDETIKMAAKDIKQHRWGEKVIESGFFKFDGAENISAVIFNSSATISKFNRMGLLTGFGSKRVRLTRQGVSVNPDLKSGPIPFHLDVNAPEYEETWIEGMNVFHNPWAKYPLHPGMLPGAAHHRLRVDGQIESIVPDRQVLSSTTSIFVAKE